jgi:hypothetical protein
MDLETAWVRRFSGDSSPRMNPVGDSESTMGNSTACRSGMARVPSIAGPKRSLQSATSEVSVSEHQPSFPPINHIVCKMKRKKLTICHLNCGGGGEVNSTTIGASTSNGEQIGSVNNSNDKSGAGQPPHFHPPGPELPSHGPCGAPGGGLPGSDSEIRHAGSRVLMASASHVATVSATDYAADFAWASGLIRGGLHWVGNCDTWCPLPLGWHKKLSCT